MNRSLIRSRSITVTLLLGLFSVLTVASLVVFPAQAFAASLAGLQFWWNIVFPAMLPYVILVNIAAEYGLFRLAGHLLSPLARRIGLPAESGSILAAGLALGYAAGTRRAVNRQGRYDGKSVGPAVSGFASPVLVLVVLAAILPGKPTVFIVLLFIHYTAWLLAVLLVVFLKGKRGSGTGRNDISSVQPSVKPAASPKKSDTFGQVLGTCVTDGLQKMMELGGLIILFAVAARMLQLFGVADLLAGLVTRLGLPFTGETIMPFLAGLLDIHNGMLALSRSPVPAPQAIYFLAALLAWGGLAVHFEVRAMLRKAGLRYGPYVRFRLIHVAASIAVTACLWPLIGKRLAPWPVHGEQAAVDAAASLWPEPAGMPGSALITAGLIVLLLLGRMFSRVR